ncbi:LOW QUALITY PROTEIN: Cytochrome P450 [Colletotrichum higginsianum IMI 349063]|uniref:Cytochrome P450 n=1 Tax=Colletotrichum higginsianum (strain IMI 349063) TaxID=759273 RepID=A0A1B7XXK0_COLHI|nr:LOW QUALITY PROTEIN: Cytochrome P450 [Colletotrichum higginsianum IMI 349063]OBR04496.1 LOW QUALITY PROTEIN: Cytochrome P450 [Colletotrichum higginsianum IMI 349063]
MKQWPEAPFVRYLSMGNCETLMVNNIAAFKEVQQAKVYSFRKSQLAARMFSPITGHGLMFSEGEERKKQRTQLARAFSNQNTRKMLPVFQLKANQLCGSISQDLGAEETKVVDSNPPPPLHPGSAGSEPFLLVPSLPSPLVEHFLKKSTLDVFVIGSIGCDLDSIFVPEAHFYEVYERIIRQPPSGHVITFIDGHVPLRSWLPLASNKRWLKDVALIRAMLLTCVENRRHEMMAEKKLGLEDKTDRHDILTFILEDCQFDATQTNWTDLELLEYMLNFIAGAMPLRNLERYGDADIMAGHETTGSTTMWVAHVLATVPKVQDRLKQEVLGLCAGKPRDWNPTYEELEHLVYMNHFLKEILRFYSPGKSFTPPRSPCRLPPAIFLPREASEDVTVCGTFIPKGTQVTLCPAVAHFNPLVWGETAEAFDPDRWADGRAPGDSYAMEAFLQGPAGCIAKNMALLNTKSVIFALARDFRFSPRPGWDGRLELANPNFTLRPRESLRVTIEREEARQVTLF